MPIAFDAATTAAPVDPGTSQTFAHVCTGSNRLLLVGIKGVNDVASLITGVTYAGEALAFVGQVRISAGRWVDLYIKVNPASGSNDVIINASSSSFIAGMAVSYNGCKQTGQPDNSATNTQVDIATYNQSLTPVLDNSWVAIVAGCGDGIAPGAGTTERVTTDIGTISMGDNNALITPPASTQLQYTSGLGTSDWASVMVSLAPFVAASALPFITTIGAKRI